MSAVRLFFTSCARQSVISATFERRSLTEKASSRRVSSISERIISGLRVVPPLAIRS
jgi:hypothetical protein